MYSCEHCNFEASKAHDLLRHKSTLKHLQMIQSLNISDDKYICKNVKQKEEVIKFIPLENLAIKKKQPNAKIYTCDCGKECNSRQSFYYHKTVCKKGSVEDELLALVENENLDELKNKIIEIKNQKELEKKPKKKTLNNILNTGNLNSNHSNTNNNTIDNSINTNNNNSTKNNTNNLINAPSVSVYNYIKQTYTPNEPLMSLTEKEVLKLLELTPEQSGGHCLGELILFHYGKQLFGQFIGDFIINAYKRKDPQYQKFWASDIQRLTFIIRRELSKNEGVWAQDKKGICLIKFVIAPVIETVEAKIEEYKIICDNNLHDPDLSYDLGDKYMGYIYSAEKLLLDITTKEAHSKVLRYIAPHFQIEI